MTTPWLPTTSDFIAVRTWVELRSIASDDPIQTGIERSDIVRGLLRGMRRPIRPRVPTVVAHMVHGLAQECPYADGNKRTALELAQVTLAANGWVLQAAPDEWTVLLLRAARGDIHPEYIERWIGTRAEITLPP